MCTSSIYVNLFQVGDRLDTDIMMGINCGMDTCLVLRLQQAQKLTPIPTSFLFLISPHFLLLFSLSLWGSGVTTTAMLNATDNTIAPTYVLDDVNGLV